MLSYGSLNTHWLTYDTWSGPDADAQRQPLARAHSDWTGLPMTASTLPGDAEITNLRISGPTLLVARSGRGKRRYTCGLQTRDLYSKEHMFELYGDGFCIDHGRWKGTTGEVVGVQFSTIAVNRLLHAEGSGFNLPTCHELFDDSLTGLALMLWNEAESGSPRGKLFTHGLTLALIGLLIEQHGACRKGDIRSQSKLSPIDRATLSDYIEDHLESDLSVETLASLVSTSPYHFSRAFKATFNISPHAYVTERRLERAGYLLREKSDRSLADIALSLGFSSQSHFTEAFRRKIGTTPGRWRTLR